MRRYERIIEVDAPVERVFDMLGEFEAAPRWAGGVRAVRRTGRRTFLWVMGTALDVDVEWEAEVTVFEPDRRIVWRAFRGDVRADFEAILSVTPEGTTLVRAVRGYETPAGRSGGSVARFFGEHPARMLEEDLSRLKRFAERSRRMGVEPARRRERRAALSPRERERERERARAALREEEERIAAGWYLRRGVDRLMERRAREERRAR